MSDSVRLSDEKSGGCLSPAAQELAAAAANPRLTEEPLVFAFVASSALVKPRDGESPQFVGRSCGEAFLVKHGSAR